MLAGTPWLLASSAMRDNPVDVLVVNDTGQLGLADTLAASISAKNVVLLDVRWRMRPDVCSFISEVSYDGKLTSDVSRGGRQSTAAGTGLRWLRAEHVGHSSGSPEEAALVVSTIRGLLGRGVDRSARRHEAAHLGRLL